MQEEVRWSHFSDVHLDYHQYNLIERFNDFFRGFDAAMTKALEHQPNFIVISGDLFEHHKPSPPAIRQAVYVLRKAKEKNIPVYVIAGNHDQSYSYIKRYGGDVLHFLNDLGLVIYLSGKNEILLHKNKNGEPIALLAGINYAGKLIGKKITDFVKRHNETLKKWEGKIPRILLLHAFIKECLPYNYELTSYELRQLPFDYIALGHYHGFWEDPEGKIFNPGSTEHRSTKEWGKESTRGLYNVTAHLNGKKIELDPKYVRYPVRKKVSIAKDFGTITKQELENEVKKILTENDEEGICLRVSITARVTDASAHMINLRQFKTLTTKTLITLIDQHITDTQLPTKKVVTLGEAIDDLLNMKYKISPNEIGEYHMLIENVLGMAKENNFKAIDEAFNHFLAKIKEPFSGNAQSKGQ